MLRGVSSFMQVENIRFIGIVSNLITGKRAVNDNTEVRRIVQLFVREKEKLLKAYPWRLCWSIIKRSLVIFGEISQDR
jgi:hypothetical protein